MKSTQTRSFIPASSRLKLEKGIGRISFFLLVAVVLLSFNSCESFYENPEHTNPLDAVYENQVGGEKIRIVLGNPVATSPGKYTISWSEALNGEKSSEYLSSAMVLYVKTGDITEMELAEIVKNSATISGSFTTVTKETPLSALLSGYSGKKTFIVAIPSKVDATKMLYSNVVSYDF